MTGFVAVLSAWVREIILVVFLAGTLEMLLPETEVKRFARVAMGFFIVLVVARPILSLAGGGFYFDTGLASLGSWEVSGPAGAISDPAFERGADFQYASRDRALAAARAALEAQLIELALREPEVADARVEVDLVTDLSSAGYGHLRAVRVVVRLVREAGPETALSPGRETHAGLPLEPVRIGVDPVVVGGGTPGAIAVGHGGSSSGLSGGMESTAAGGPAAVESGVGPGSGTGPAAELARRLRSTLVLLLGVPPGGITVEVWP